MRIGWLVPHLGCFGSVREMIELSNALIERGHEVTIHHETGEPCRWLPCAATISTPDTATTAGYDLLLLVTEWRRDEYARLLAADALRRGVVMMGFAPSDDTREMLRGWPHSPEDGPAVLADALHRTDVDVFADGPWQLDWIREHLGIEGATWIGGVNTQMFYPDRSQRDWLRIGASGDPRDRKGTDVVMAALRKLVVRHPSLRVETYWGRGYSQSELVKWYQRQTIYLDGHRRAGWCNPVFEAMACGCAVVCTDIGAVRPLAVHGESAMIVPVDDVAGMVAAVDWLLGSAPRIERISHRAQWRASRYTYGRAAWRLERWLERALA